VVEGGTAGDAKAGGGVGIVLVTCATAGAGIAGIAFVTCATAGAGITGIGTFTGEATAAAIGAASYIIGTASLCNSVSAKSAARDANGELIYIYIYGF